MRVRSVVRWVVPVVVSTALVASAFPAVVAGPAAVATPRADRLPGAVIASALEASGDLVRDRDGVRVTEVPVPARLRTAGVPPAVYRVRVAGSFPPRALRYVVRAAGRPVALGIPSGDLRSLVAVTSDATVVTSPIDVRYGGRPATTRPVAGARPETTASLGTSGASKPAPGLPRGPLPVVRRVYDLGTQVFQPSGLRGKVELIADVHFPKGLPGGPYPVVLFLHGNHVTCFRDHRVAYRWPCKPGWKPIPSFRGYDYIASRLASFGYVVVSASANGVNVLGNQVNDTGMRQRGELLERHLELWRDWSTTGGAPFGQRFVGKVDLSRTGTMGHSRGGEGAVWQVIVDRERDEPFGIDAVLPLAPVDFTRETVNDVPLAVMLPYCDGDVFDLQGIHFFDDARYRQPGDPTPKHTVTVFGANHNFFNTVWTPGGGFPGGFDDGTHACQGRLRPVEERRAGAAYVVSFFRRYVGGELGQDRTWTGARTAPGIAPAETLTTYLAPDTPGRRLDLARFTDVTSLSRNDLGGVVVPRAMSIFGWCADTMENPCVSPPYEFADVHMEGVSRGVFGWTRPKASVRFRLPVGTGDLRGFQALQLRTALDPGYAANRVKRQDLAVTLIDGNGDRDQVAASSVGDRALAFPPGLKRGLGHVILQQLRFPLSAFEGVDLTDVRFVLLRFSRTKAGLIHVADLAFSAGAR